MSWSEGSDGLVVEISWRSHPLANASHSLPLPVLARLPFPASFMEVECLLTQVEFEDMSADSRKEISQDDYSRPSIEEGEAHQSDGVLSLKDFPEILFCLSAIWGRSKRSQGEEGRRNEPSSRPSTKVNWSATCEAMMRVEGVNEWSEDKFDEIRRTKGSTQIGGVDASGGMRARKGKGRDETVELITLPFFSCSKH
jgi:hypothetical protein